MAGDLGIIVAGAVGAWGATTGMKPRRSIGSIVANITIEEHHHDELEVTDHPVERGASISDHAYKRPNEVTITCAWSNSPGAPGSLLSGVSGALANKLTGTVYNQLTGAGSAAIGGSALGNTAVANLGRIISNPLISFGAQVNSGTGKGTSTVQDVYQQLLDLQASAQPVTVYTGKRKYEDMVIRSITTETDVKTENSLVCRITLRQVILVNTTLISVTAAPADQADPSRTDPPVNDGTKQLVEVNTDGDTELGRTLINIYPDGSFVEAFPVK